MTDFSDNKSELRVFIDVLGAKVRGSQEDGLSADFILPGMHTLVSEDTFVESGRDFLARLASAPAAVKGLTGNFYYWYGFYGVLSDFLVNSCLVDRMRLTRVLVLNRLRHRMYMFRYLPCLPTRDFALSWTLSASSTIGVRFRITLLFSTRRLLHVLVWHLFTGV